MLSGAVQDEIKKKAIDYLSCNLEESEMLLRNGYHIEFQLFSLINLFVIL